ncbi:LAFE_0H04082g1_1 [Lachancea fermentati]|uniref:LAFE_0H04082g1_1 n=1 Tax=Lachancea fermentati TaxID=4955 RepID=A0A1G4MJF7_LACFM|nr:LAFE_0H04082g1_1 [Lachancea fermentati]
MSTKQCPQCGSDLKKCLIQQNYSLVMCPQTDCSYPFNDSEVTENIVYTEDKEILKAAKSRLKEGKENR